MRTLTSGGGRSWRRQSRRKSRSRSLRVRSRSACSSIGSPRTFAWRIARLSSHGLINPCLPGADATRRRSAIVRAGVVTGIPLQSVTTAGRSERDRCRRIPRRPLLPPYPGIETSIGPSRTGSSCHRWAALRWLRAAPQRPRMVSASPAATAVPGSSTTPLANHVRSTAVAASLASRPQAMTAAIHPRSSDGAA